MAERKTAGRRVRRLGWLALVVAWPVPLALVGRGTMPAGAVAELACATALVGVFEHAGGILPTLAVVLALQAVAWAAVEAVAAGVIVRVLHRLLGQFGVGLALAAVLAGVVYAACTPIYRSPFHRDRPRQTLVQVYQ